MNLDLNSDLKMNWTLNLDLAPAFEFECPDMARCQLSPCCWWLRNVDWNWAFNGQSLKSETKSTSNVTREQTCIWRLKFVENRLWGWIWSTIEFDWTEFESSLLLRTLFGAESGLTWSLKLAMSSNQEFNANLDPILMGPCWLKKTELVIEFVDYFFLTLPALHFWSWLWTPVDVDFLSPEMRIEMFLKVSRVDLNTIERWAAITAAAEILIWYSHLMQVRVMSFLSVHAELEHEVLVAVRYFLDASWTGSLVNLYLLCLLLSLLIYRMLIPNIGSNESFSCGYWAPLAYMKAAHISYGWLIALSTTVV